MGRITLPLSDAQIRKAKPKDKRYKLSDGNGLYLFVHPTGQKAWRVRYRTNGKTKEITIGYYPAVGLKEAREKAIEIKQAVLEGVDPRQFFIKEEEKKDSAFKDVVEGFLRVKEKEWSASHYFRQIRRIELYILPHIGNKDITEIAKQDIVKIVESVANKKITSAKRGDKVETSKRIFTLLRQIFRYAIHSDLCDVDPTAKMDISAILPKTQGGNLKALTDPSDIKSAFKLIRNYEGIVTRLALEFLALSALRPGNVRNMRWKWVNLKEKVVKFPREAMKGRVEYRLPLTRRMVEILEEIGEFTQGKEFVFCSPIAPSKPMSENTLNYAHKRIGLENHNAHGWRSSFSTVCYEKQREHGYGYEVIESQLAHKVGNSVKMAYLRSDFLEERRGLLSWWESFLFG